MSIEVSLPDSLRPALEFQMQANGYGNFAECVTALLNGKIGEQSSVRNSVRNIAVDGVTFHLFRICDRMCFEWTKRAIAIEEVPLDPWQLMSDEPNQLNLAETYAVLKLLFGERSRCFDHWKGSFAFPLALHIETVTPTPAYLLDVVNYRSGVEYRFRRIVAPDDPRLDNPRYYRPEPDFPHDTMRRFLSQFVGYQEGYWRSCCELWDDRFMLQVPSNLILFGFDGRELFQRGFEHAEDYARARGELSDRLGEPGYYR